MSASYNYCQICGHTPRTANNEPNYVHRFWDADDGWKIGALCRWCWDEAQADRPKPSDYAYDTTNGVADEVDTDEDPTPYIDEAI